MPEPPTLPDRYQDVRHLADGGMASVWVARDARLDREVAIKVLTGTAAVDPVARERFTREGRAAARASRHPNVVTVYDAGEQDGSTFLVMALYRGGTVADRLRCGNGGAVSRARALGWLRDAAAGLDAAHAEGVVHRDVKPGNLMIDDGGRVAVGDFGIASAGWSSDLTQTGMVLGTLAYLAPEQRDGRGATPASDRWALGVVARQLLTGRLPGDPDAPALPAGAEAALRRATSRDPAARFATCTAFVDALEEGLRARPATAAAAMPATAPTAVAAVTAAPVRRRRLAAAAAGCVAALAAALVLIAILGGDGTPTRAATTGRTTPARTTARTQPAPTPTISAPVTASATPAPAPQVPPARPKDAPGHGPKGKAKGHHKGPHGKGPHGKAKGGRGGPGR